MSLPSLEQQIRFVDLIVEVCIVQSSSAGTSYRIEKVMKSRYAAPAIHEPVNADLSIFELLGYPIQDGKHAVIFLAANKRTSYDCIQYLPVINERITYGIKDESVSREVTISELRELITLHGKDG